MKYCPDCGREMERGYLYGQAPLFWSPKENKRTLIPGKEAVSVIQGHTPTAWICRLCHKIIVAY